jgi:hypothetical protein
MRDESVRHIPVNLDSLLASTRRQVKMREVGESRKRLSCEILQSLDVGSTLRSTSESNATQL